MSLCALDARLDAAVMNNERLATYRLDQATQQGVCHKECGERPKVPSAAHLGNRNRQCDVREAIYRLVSYA